MASPQLIKSGPERQVNNGATAQNNGQVRADIATLSDGRYLVVFTDPEGTFDIAGQFVNADGTLVGTSLAFGNSVDQIGIRAGNQDNSAVAARPGGNAVVVWFDQNVGGGDIEVTVLNAAGNELTPGTELNVITDTTGAGNLQVLPDVATLSDGRSLIVWQHAGATQNIHSRLLNAAGTGFTTADKIDVDNGAGNQASPSVAASGLLALVAYDDDTAGNSDIVARLFNGATDTYGAEFVIADKSVNVFAPEVAALADQRFAIAYSNGIDVFFRIFDPTTPDSAFLSVEVQVDAPSGSASAARVTGTLDGGFIVTWAQDSAAPNGFDIHQRRYDAHGLAYGDDFIVNTLQDGSQFRPAVATSGANVLTVWDDQGGPGREDTSDFGIRSQAFTTTAFDYDSARFADFDNDGRDDILFQNDTGDLTLWRTNSAGTFASATDLGSLPGNFRIDGTGNFNNTPGADILLRNPTTVAVLVMNGVTPQGVQNLGGTSPDWLNSGMGEFTGDGQTDLLFRNINTGQIATWGVANNTLSTPPTVLGSAPSQFQIVAVDDFTGDNQADILFRNLTNGDIAIWRVANNALAGAPAVVGSTSTAYHVVGVGDFDGNSSNDILFRNGDGQLAMWLLNSQGQLLGAPVAIGNAALDFHVEGTGDLNGDSRDDIVFRHADGTIVAWFMNGAAFAAPPAVVGVAQVDHAIAAHHFDLI